MVPPRSRVVTITTLTECSESWASVALGRVTRPNGSAPRSIAPKFVILVVELVADGGVGVASHLLSIDVHAVRVARRERVRARDPRLMTQMVGRLVGIGDCRRCSAIGKG